MQFQRADCDTDHFLVIAKLMLKVQGHKELQNRNSTRINLEMLKNEEIQQKYSTKVGEYVKTLILLWMKTGPVSKAVKEIAVEYVGKIKTKKTKCYNENCKQAVERRRITRENFISVGNIDTKELYALERKSCKRVIQRKKGSISMRYYKKQSLSTQA